MQANAISTRTIQMFVPPSNEASSRLARILCELEALSDDLRIQCADAGLEGNFGRIEELLCAARAIETIRNGVKDLTVYWPEADRAAQEVRDGRGPQTRLRIVVVGRTIEEARAKDSFVEALRLLGFEKVEALGKKLRGIPLVSRNPCHDKKYDQAKRDGWYITVHSSTSEKRALLEEIGAILRVPISVGVI